VVTLAMSAAGMAAVAGPAAAADTASINGATTFQTIAGFGASEGFYQAATIMNLPSAAQPASTISVRSRCVTGNHSSASGVSWWLSRRASGRAGFRYFHPPNAPPLPVTSGKVGG
jgi:hypothetical protein